MATTWLDKAERYLATAQLLLELGDYESSLSRAYYAVRYTCLHFLQQEGMPVDRYWKHHSVIGEVIQRARQRQWLRALVISGQPTFARSLDKLLELREMADYDLSMARERDAQRALHFAQTLYGAVKENQP
jgi:uncharacterized protein (UPF0332 family)